MSKEDELWFKLCQEASVEQDPARLLALVQQINSLLEKKGKGTSGGRSGTDFSTE